MTKNITVDFSILLSRLSKLFTLQHYPATQASSSEKREK
ncbi:hypothetical protein RV06_GL002051 [Enterococcus haemoperoxidus]|nr:hypothetical protein RV06_GL002051 [Enterococcus haemoperoxidus]